MKKTSPTDAWSYDLRKVTLAAAVVYGYAFGMPLVTFGINTYLGFPMRLAQLVCIYGYSLTAFVTMAPLTIPVALVCKFNFDLVYL
jgi:hypothetical protein